MDPEGRRRAAKAVERKMAELGLTNADMVRVAKIDKGTLGTFLAGETWPRRGTLAKIEDALGWSTGTISDIADGTVATYLAAEPSTSSGAGAAYEAFTKWADLRAQILHAALEYSRVRGVELGLAQEELEELWVMAHQAKDGRPWTPPWDEHPDGSEPWRESWWLERQGRARMAQGGQQWGTGTPGSEDDEAAGVTVGEVQSGTTGSDLPGGAGDRRFLKIAHDLKRGGEPTRKTIQAAADELAEVLERDEFRMPGRRDAASRYLADLHAWLDEDLARRSRRGADLLEFPYRLAADRQHESSAQERDPNVIGQQKAGEESQDSEGE